MNLRTTGTSTCRVAVFNCATLVIVLGIFHQVQLTNGDDCLSCLWETGAMSYTSIAQNPAFLVTLNSTELSKLCSTFSSIQVCANFTGCSEYMNDLLQKYNAVTWSTFRDALTLMCSDAGKQALLSGQQDCYTREFETLFGACFMKTFNLRPLAGGSWCNYSDALRSLRSECLPQTTRTCRNESVKFVQILLDIILPTVPADQLAICESQGNQGVPNSVTSLTTRQLIMTLSAAVVLLTSTVAVSLCAAAAAAFAFILPL